MERGVAVAVDVEELVAAVVVAVVVIVGNTGCWVVENGWTLLVSV